MDELLLFLHVLAACALLGGLGAVALTAVAAPAAARASARLVALPASVVTIVLGEGLRSRQGASGGWLDASYLLGYGLLLVGSAVVMVLTWRAASSRAAAILAATLVAAGLATTFLMAARP